MTRILPVAFSLLFSFAASALAAGPFDGNWTGEANGMMSPTGRGSGSGLCSGSATAAVKDNVLTGSMQLGRSNPGFGGKIAADGSFTGHVGQFPATGKFNGSTFSGNFNSTANCAEWRITMNRSAGSN
jgi:hypothetical protein